jgi:SAM-dependent MidA family methyltransferase
LSEIIEKIATEIRAGGAISFARFMDIALYCPDCGFYEKEKDNVGKRGDFFTSVNVGELFGQLLAFQFSDWFEAKDETRNTQYGTHFDGLKIVEAGAHDGQLAKDVLTWMRDRRPETFQRLKYYIVEPSARRREWQQATLKEFADMVMCVSEITDLKTTLQTAKTIIFSNELLDAMPVHRLGWDAKAKQWFEWGVAFERNHFVWSRMPASPIHVSRFTFQDPTLLDVLPDAYTIEFSPAAEAWWCNAAEVLVHGKVLTFDYGLTADEQFSPSRMNGTFRAYHRHQVTDDVLANPGEQDLTAHVNFSAIQTVGEAAGLRTELFSPQPQFLTRIVENIFKNPAAFGEWGTKQTRQFQTLTHPEHLGRAFRVLVQSR